MIKIQIIKMDEIKIKKTLGCKNNKYSLAFYLFPDYLIDRMRSA
jgi:hypothetical protein